MIREFQATDLEKIGEIWLNTNIKAHDFIPDPYYIAGIFICNEAQSGGIGKRLLDFVKKAEQN